MTLDLAANEFREHRREDLITKLAPVSVEATAKCQTFLAFLDRILAGNRALAEFLQTFFGYCLSGSVSEQVLVILYGLGANGKTTLIKAITAILGDYALTTPVTTLLQRKNETIPNDIARLAGARLVIAHEVEGGKRLAESLVKTLTGGDNITGRFLHQEYFEFQPTFKVLLVTNHKPVIRGTDHAIWRRIRLVPFTVTISPEEQDHALGEKLIAENSGILNWMLDGFAKWQKHGLGNPADIASATEGYRQEMDSLGDWIEACCHAQPDAEATAKDLFASYASYLGDAREQPLSKRIFGMKLSERGFVSTRSKQERIWRGISLVTR
jgi:putative DNA primase/helicase